MKINSNLKKLLSKAIDFVFFPDNPSSLGNLLRIILLGSLLGLINVLFQPSAIWLTADDNGRQIEIDKEVGSPVGEGYYNPEGQILIISLKANWTAGYTWEIAELDTNILRQKGESEFKRSESNESSIEGIQILRFKSVNRGKTPLKLIYHHFRDNEPMSIFIIQVVVH